VGVESKWWLNTILWVEIVFLSKKIQFLIIVLYLQRWSGKFFSPRSLFIKRNESSGFQGKLSLMGSKHTR
jgi:hypothetical protein